jgi:hypothetical protein
MDFDSIDGRFVARKGDEVVSVELDGEAVLFHEQDETLHVLSQSATIIWNLLDGHSSLDKIAELIAEAFRVEFEVMRRDVIGAVRNLGARGLLEGVPGDPHLRTLTAIRPVTQAGTDD